jgi:sialic acid synthase SpsE
MSTTDRVLVIAEIGVNHNGELALAKEMVDAAARSDVDVIKFQTAKIELLQVESAPKARYQEETTEAVESSTEMLSRLQLTYDEFTELKAYIEDRGKEFLSTAFDLVSLDFLQTLGMSRYKIPSGEITNLPYIRAVARRADDVILSTGMATLDEIGRSVDAIEAEGLSRRRITVLQCNTAYPSPLGDTNLRAMVSFADRFGTAYGYSDHTVGSVASLAAVALGATVIEKHVTTDRTLPGPDQHASMEPDDFVRFVADIRAVGETLGSAVKDVTASELENRPIARRGLYFARDLEAGAVIGEQDVIALRPEAEVSPMDVDVVVGRTLTGPARRHEPVPTSLLDPPR